MADKLWVQLRRELGNVRHLIRISAIPKPGVSNSCFAIIGEPSLINCCTHPVTDHHHDRQWR